MRLVVVLVECRRRGPGSEAGCCPSGMEEAGPWECCPSGMQEAELWISSIIN